MGDAIYRDMDALRDILRAIDDSQRLEPPLVVRPGVREEEATYLALPACLPMDGVPHIVRQLPAYH
jgi:hypothetical protein